MDRKGRPFTWPEDHEFGRFERALDRLAGETRAELDRYLVPIADALARFLK
ncbi:hypothetical protein [Profundibacterium mesophilum]|uniref:Uncharacterized protein n=1 Tax=Profundibacterium mesophilum KAUST100406-0324 TaxID=1037889 RepID=A0A921TC57_9RHOB|nr:hypothetical protein [Profundibacterium mesophilum]KAF0674472.1 hypothetical protein PMES_03234 [Profundibacterium mesophilum KAUST100406-0324]